MPWVRNLCYHVCPVAGNGIWQWNVEQLLQRMSQFNGRRVVAIVTGNARRTDNRKAFHLDPPGLVKQAFAGHVHEFIELPNDPRLREVVTFLPLMERAVTADPHQLTFYGHAKGVTRPPAKNPSIRRWTELLYETNLDFPDLVAEQLEQHPITGALKKVCRGFEGSASRWHYTGTFFWVRNSKIFLRQWQRVDQAWWGVESWPGIHFNVHEAGCLFHEGQRELNMFSPSYVRDVVEPAYRRWKEGQYVGIRA